MPTRRSGDYLGKRTQTMTDKRKLLLTVLTGAAIAGAYVYAQRPQGRIPSPEGIEDPGVAAGFRRVASWPQMQLLRRYVAGRALRLADAGEAADLGCGPGDLVLLLARQAPKLRLTGIDLSDEMLAEAERRAAVNAALSDRVAFRKGDAARVPLPNGSQDLVVSTLSLHHWSDPVAALDEIARVLRSGGAFMIFDLRRDLSPPLYLLLWFATRFVVPGALRRAGEPLGSRNAAYTPDEAILLAQESRLSGWRVTRGPLWLTIEGHTPRALSRARPPLAEVSPDGLG